MNHDFNCPFSFLTRVSVGTADVSVMVHWSQILARFLVFSIKALDFNAKPESYLTAYGIFAHIGSWTPTL